MTAAQRPSFVAAAILLIAAACSPFGGGGTASAPAEKHAGTASAPSSSSADRIRVRTERPSCEAIAAFLETTSHVEAIEEADIYPRVTGVVQKLLAEEGDRVKAGDVLAIIDRREAEISLEQAKIAQEEATRIVEEAKLAFDEAQKKVLLTRADADQAKRDYERDAKLGLTTDSGGLRIVAPKVIEASKLAWDRCENFYTISEFAVRRAELAKGAAETGKKKADWNLRLSQVRLDDTEVKAPISGVVSLRAVKQGETATPQVKVFRVTDLEKLRTVFYRPQRDLRVLADGVKREVTATSEAILDRPDSSELRTFHGRVELVSPVVDPANGSFKVTASLKNPDSMLRPGILVRVRVTLGRHENAYLVSKRARVLEGERPFVFVVRAGETVRIPIEEGFSDADRIEVRNVGVPGGLRCDDEVVTVANVDLKEGLRVSSESAGNSGG